MLIIHAHVSSSSSSVHYSFVCYVVFGVWRFRIGRSDKISSLKLLLSPSLFICTLLKRPVCSVWLTCSDKFSGLSSKTCSCYSGMQAIPSPPRSSCWVRLFTPSSFPPIADSTSGSIRFILMFYGYHGVPSFQNDFGLFDHGLIQIGLIQENTSLIGTLCPEEGVTAGTLCNFSYVCAKVTNAVGYPALTGITLTTRERQ